MLLHIMLFACTDAPVVSPVRLLMITTSYYSTLALVHDAHNIFLPFRARSPHNHLLSAILII
jgi:hypothetical protein